MEAKSGLYTIEITAQECYDIAFSIFKDLQASIEEHWVNHLEVDWKHEEAPKIFRMKKFFQLGLYPRFFDDKIQELDKFIIEAKQKAVKI